MGGHIIISSEDAEDGALVRIKDFGIRIQPEIKEKGFERFFCIDSGNAKVSGLGLGLYITSEIIKQHQCSLNVESEPGKGAEFYFKLPYILPDVLHK